MNSAPFEISNVTDATADVTLYGVIGGEKGISADKFISALDKHSGKKLTIRIHSPGGSINDGSAIFNALKRHKGGVVTQIDGLAASMASYIAMAGSRVLMAENAQLMIHNPSTSGGGNSQDMRRMADLMDVMRDNIISAYVGKTGIPANEVGAMMDAETWLSAKAAKERGFVDEITDRLEIAAQYDLSGFANAPTVDTPREAMDATALSAELTTARESLTIAQAQAQKNFADFTAKVAEVENLKSEVEGYKAKLDAEVAKFSALNEDNSKLKTDLENAQNSLKEVTAQANAKITAELAKAGHEPVGADVTSSPVNEPKKPELFGLARVIHALQTSKK